MSKKAMEGIPVWGMTLFSRFLLPLVALFLPYCAAFWMLQEVESRSTAVQTQQIQENLGRTLARISQAALPVSHFKEISRSICRALGKDQDLTHILAGMKPRALDLFVFDKQGKRLPVPGASTELVGASERFQGFLTNLRNDPGFQLSRPQEKMAESFLGGRGVMDSLINSANQVVALPEGEFPRLGGVFDVMSTRHGPITVLMHVDLRKVDGLTLLRKVISRLRRTRRHLPDIGFLPFASPIKSQFAREPLPSFLIPRLFQERIDSGFSSQGRVFQAVTLASLGRIYASLPQPLASPWLFRGRQLANLLILLMMVAYFWFQIKGLETPISLRFQLIALFTLAGVAGVALLLGFAQSYRTSLEQAFVRETRAKAGEILEKADDSFATLLKSQGRQYEVLVRKLEGDFPDYQHILSPCEKRQREGKIGSLYLVDTNGRILLKYVTPRGSQEQNWAFNGEQNVILIGKSVLSRFNRVPLSPQDQKRIETNLYLKLVADELTNSFLKNLGKMSVTTVNDRSFTDYVQVVRDEKKAARALLIISHNTRVFEKAFVKGMFNKLKKMRSDQNFVALPKEHVLGMVPYPILLRHEAELSRLNEVVSRLDSTESNTGLFGGQESVLTGRPGKNFQSFNLFSITSLTPLKQRSKQLANGFYLMGGLLLCLGVFLGNILSNVLLTPIGQLTQGVISLSESRFNEICEIHSHDEFEDLSRSLWEIRENLKDRQFAQSIQEALLPASPLDDPDVWCMGWTRSNREIGSEFVDFVRLPDGRVAVVMASLGGHAVGSALLIAMTKMALRLFFELETIGAAATLRELFLHFSGENRLNQNPAIPGFESSARAIIPDAAKIHIFLGLYNPETRLINHAQVGGFWGVLTNPEKLAASTCRFTGSSLVALSDQSLAISPGASLVLGIVKYPPDRPLESARVSPAEVVKTAVDQNSLPDSEFVPMLFASEPWRKVLAESEGQAVLLLRSK